MGRQLCVGLVFAALILSVNAASAQTVLFADDMSAATNWTLHKTTDTTSQFGFDYSALGIPVAPRGSDTIGLKLEANNTLPTSTAPHESIVARHADAAFTGQYTLRVDIWNNYAWAAGGAGTTEHAGAGVGHNGVATGVNGASFLFDGDGGVLTTSTTNGDYALYKNATLIDAATGQYAAGTVAASKSHVDPLYTNAFPAIDILTTVPIQNQNASATQLAGSGGFQWMTINIEVDTNADGASQLFPANKGTAKISMRSATSKNAIVIGTIDNSQAAIPVSLSGAISLLAHDQFGSVTTNAALDFTVFDNVKVFSGLVPLPTTNPTGDFDADADVDSQDFLKWQRGESPNFGSDQDFTDWKNNWPTPFLAVAAGTSVPEPASAALLLVCGAAALLHCRRAIIARA